MKTLRINIKDKIATFFQRDGVIVCGNKGYKLVFTFDEDWADCTTKTARFIWNGHYYDKQFTDNECEVPVLNDTTKVTVGVYAGDLKTTTPAEIPCLISIICGNPEYIEENIKEYRDIAQQSAEEAQQAAREAKQAATAVVHPTIDVEEIEGGHRLTINDADGEKTFDVMDGESGATPGESGEDGATFTPSVSSDGILSWTNNKDLPNPAPVNIKGAPGADGKDGKDGVGISATRINADGELVITYTNGNVSNLGRVVGADGEDGEDADAIDEFDADKVYFEGELVTTYAMGNIQLTNGSATLVAEGEKKSLRQLWDEIYMKETDPSITDPTCTISVSGGKKEVGETYTYPTATLTANTGEYGYGSIDANDVKYSAEDGTGIVFAAGDVTLKVGGKQPVSNASAMKTGSTLKLQATGSSNTYVDGDTNYTFTATAQYTESDRVPVTNLGNKRESLRCGYSTTGNKTTITVSSKTATFTGYRKTFYGVLSSKETLTNANIRTICEKLSSSTTALSNGSTFTIEIPKSTTDNPIYRVLIAYPSTLRDVSEVLDKNNSNQNIASGFWASKQLLNVKGANGYTAKEYKVFTLDFSDPYDTKNTYTVKI